MSSQVFIAGAGGIGQATGLILAEKQIFPCTIVFGDISQKALDAAIDFVMQGTTRDVEVSGVLMSRKDSNDEMNAAFEASDAILDCLPGSQAPRIAGLAKEYNCHYANLTEYVAETNQIKELAADANTGFVLQTGLAPGFVNILACQLYKDFTTQYGVEVVDDIAMKVGALSKHAEAPHYYAFTWSPIGVATEYMKDAEVVADFKKAGVQALSGAEQIIIDGELYEDNYTSGGAADLPEAFAGRSKNLHYKTIRYVGHYDWVKETVEKLTREDDIIKALEQKMLTEIPSVEDDMVIVYASVKGKDQNGRLRKLEKSYKILPSKIGTQTLRAIQTTTAASLCEMAYLMIEQGVKGVVLQSQVDSEKFMNGPFVSAIYGSYS